MAEDKIRASLLKESKASKREKHGKILSFAAIGLIVIVVVAIFIFVATRGIATFTVDKGSLWDFFTKSQWNPGATDKSGHPLIGALPMIVGSFAVTLLSAVVATPFAIAAAIYMVEISPRRGYKILQPVIELLVGIPSVVYGFVGLSLVVPFIRNHFGGTGFGILAGTMVLFVMILPTVTSMSVDALRSVPRYYREASLALGATRWQTTYKVVLRAAVPGIMTAVIFGMSRAFGEALAVQMVIGNAALLPQNLVSPASTLTSILTMGMGNSVMGSVSNNALWSLALLLLLMSLLFNILIHRISKKGALH
ncbi:phosphate ABC transporter permease subunit PstC [Schleiferilactobacillus harbinensis]|jgi:phosphate transport system permease protein|uniref:Phosphate transport system permease protein n=2 Tax=Schleiferilactobacillus harbinensis TaxID=304207 RepID=A0A510TS80_9LACO|nr:phosphate ABC transporter permease subunit PstC [Schleiferilactobacillus harbinensis]HAY53014.1 phosphate ABC transporter permease subunit PstC [Lactobacillus sp.]KRM29311.1 phosphate ABC transporter permease [Schleiferilactobacillus harbinensis DSM 16991]MBO3091369.1 phosphate ABC transporter permease subunit PstC [Schleiferilactobacillus harbinensis]MCI1687426.1 phosphate ABC transporter permease subunit PstC [Schleiferilactobacillus harbinensis]MCI1782486.1 phosphate ABC transporter perm